jgi:hypothetical protein
MSTFSFNVRRRDVAWAVALVVLLSGVWVGRGDPADAGATPPGRGIAVPVEGWASIPAAAFTAQFPDTDNVIIEAYATNTTNGGLKAPIQLPDGAQILELKAHVFDSDDTSDIWVGLYRIPNTGGAFETMAGAIAAASTSGTPDHATLSSTTIATGTEIVDNQNYGYAVAVVGTTGSVVVYNVMVRYRLGQPTG